MNTRKKISEDILLYVSTTTLRMSKVLDSKGRLVFKGHVTPTDDPLGILVFSDIFPDEPFPHLCRYTFVRMNGTTEIIDSTTGPSLDLTLQVR